jgi:hypothetical protein
VSFTKQALTALKRIAIVIGIAVAFTLGLLGAIYLSLRSSETRVPDIVGKDRAAAESTISSAGLNFRVRAMRPAGEAKPDTVLIQLPHAGEIVKVGQTVAVDISRPTKEGESSTTTSNTNTDNANKQDNTSSASANGNANDEKLKRKPANKNANDNLNSNSNRANQNRNTNRPRNENTNANPSGTPAHSNQNANSTPRGNLNRGDGNANTNSNRRVPVTAPTP